MAEGARTDPFHWSPNDPLCPLCGEALDLAPVPEKPCQTLSALTRHFEMACTRTGRLLEPARVRPPAPPKV